jgi:hypothetical protein
MFAKLGQNFGQNFTIFSKNQKQYQLPGVGLISKYISLPLHSSEQHIRANLEFSSNFVLDLAWLKFAVAALLPMCGQVELYMIASENPNQKPEPKLKNDTETPESQEIGPI